MPALGSNGSYAVTARTASFDNGVGFSCATPAARQGIRLRRERPPASDLRSQRPKVTSGSWTVVKKLTLAFAAAHG
jgi:hypothetical protein